MQQNFSNTKLPTAAGSSAIGGASAWSNPSRITADDGSSALWAAFAGAQMSLISASDFDFQQLPDAAIIDGISVFVDGSQTGCYGGVNLGITGAQSKDLGALNGAYGGATDLWGLDSIDPADIASITVSVDANDVSGGDGIASIDYVSITVFWHIEVANIESDVPTRIDYKTYSRDGNYLGLLPNVTSKLAFPEDINSAGTSIVITCGKYVDNEVTVSPLLTEDGEVITTEDDLPILATSTEILVAKGDSPDEALFKNSNRIKAWLYNSYYPNGKLMFSGQVNRVNFKYGGGDATVKLTVYSDGLDLNNFIARGYPFEYTDDVEQTSSGSFKTISTSSKDGSYVSIGQSFITGGGINNIGAISIRMNGTANVTLAVYDGVNGNLMGSVKKAVSTTWGPNSDVRFEFPSLIPVNASTSYFFAVWVDSGQSIQVASASTDVYANGSLYQATYAAGSGGGSFAAITGELYFITASGVPTTTTTYSSDDPVSDMAHGILLDYNARGGLITERDFDATGLSLTYTFVVAFIYEAIKKILELCPSGYYTYVDVGTAEIDIKQTSDTPDFTVVRGRHINELSLDLSIEQVKNYYLFTGGETGGDNLYRDYKDNESTSFYGLRTAAKTDNRVTLTATADAIGDAFIEENSDEQQETSLVVLNEHIDITLLTPGKTIGFKNYGNFIDDLVVQVARREGNYDDGVAVLTLGRLPIRMSDEVQRIQRELLNEQTINNPTAPS